MVLVSLKIARGMEHEDENEVVDLKDNNTETIENFVANKYPDAIGYKIL